MKIWGTNTGKKWLKSFLNLCQQPQHKLLVIKGGMDFSLIYNPRLKIPRDEIIEIATPEKLSNLSLTTGNRIILLDSLVCDVQINVDKGLEIAKTFCNKQGYTFMTAPYAFTSADLAHLEEEAYEGQPDAWLAGISHWIAASISHGVMRCYAKVMEIFESLEAKTPDMLPSASDCQELYMEYVRYLPSYEPVHRWFMSQSGLMLRYQERMLDAWLILWSVGLAGMLNGQWELSPVLLEGPSMVGERIHRVVEANHINIPPIYMAWVYYCEQKYKLSNDSNNLVVRYPADVEIELRTMQRVDQKDLQMCAEVRALRNWLQHGENYDRSVYQNDYMCQRTCKAIMHKMSRDGKERI